MTTVKTTFLHKHKEREANMVAVNISLDFPSYVYFGVDWQASQTNLMHRYVTSSRDENDAT